MAEEKSDVTEEVEGPLGDLSQEEIQSIMNQVCDGAGDEIKDNLSGVVKGIFQDGISPKDALGLTDKMVEGIYGQAYRMFNNGKYQDASVLFRVLMALDLSDPRFPMGVAASLHMEKDYETAAQMYAMAGVMDTSNPLPHYHASDCWLQIDDKTSAYLALKMAHTISSENPAYEKLTERCRLSMDALADEVELQDVVEGNAQGSGEKKKKKKKKAKKKQG